MSAALVEQVAAAEAAASSAAAALATALNEQAEQLDAKEAVLALYKGRLEDVTEASRRALDAAGARARANGRVAFGVR